MAKEKGQRKGKRKYLAGGNHQLLEISEVLDGILQEAENLDSEVKNQIIQASSTAWTKFVQKKESEKIKS